MLIDVVGPAPTLCRDGRGHARHSAPSSNNARTVSFVVDACAPEYAEVPCPLYPEPGAREAWSGEPSPAQPHAEAATAAARAARSSTLRGKLLVDLGSAVAKASARAPVSEAEVLASWRAEFDSGGASGCRGVAEYARFVGTEWCAAALDGPGGSRLGSSRGAPTPARNGGPLGHWCALPSNGHFAPA